MLGVDLGTLPLRGVALEEVRAHVLENLFEALPEDGFFELLALILRDFVDRVVGPVELVQATAPHGEHGAALEHLHLDAHLEHVGGRRHCDVCLLGGGQHLSDHW